jgi:hypothetical protein
MSKHRVAALVLLLAACDTRPSLAPPAAGAIALFPQQTPACRHSRDNAVARAADLERIADAHWERVPFSREEAPTAVMGMAEAESCYQLAGERAGRLRAQGKRRSFEQEATRRFARARLNLDVAVRLEQPERAQQEANELVALLKFSEDTAFRDGLRRLSHQYAAAMADSKKKGKP